MIVKKENIYLGKELKESGDKFGYFTKIIKVSAKNGLFTIDLPERIAKFYREEQVFAKTLDEVERAFKKKLEDYKERISKIRKVIVYNFQSTCYIFDKMGNKCIFRKEDISFAEGTALGLEWTIGYETDINGEKNYTYENENNFYINDKYTVIDWTQKREDFFKGFQRKLEYLILKIERFTKNKKKFLQLIDDRVKLLEMK
jgi:hypothetical protein